MNLAVRFVLVASATVVGAWALFSCSDSNAAQPAAGAPQAAAPAKPAPTEARVRERSLARWDLVSRGQWLDAYELLTPEQRRAVPLGQYLGQTEHHHYANPAIVNVISVGPVDAYLTTRAVWTPSHPELKKAHLEPGQSLTAELTMIESWRWEGDDWYYVRAQREDEFQKEHPEIQLAK